MKNCRFFLHLFFKLLRKFSDLINSDDCMGTITSKSIRIYPVSYSKTDLNLLKKGIISSEKIINSGNYMHDYAHSLTRYIGKGHTRS